MSSKNAARTPLGLLAILTVLVFGAVAAAPVAADGPSAATAAKKKCGKKGKKRAAAAKKGKCGKGKKGKRPAATGPSLPIGEWACRTDDGIIVSGLQTLAGNGYTVNRTDPGTYKLAPDTGLVNFTGGSWSWTYGIYDQNSKSITIYSNDPSVVPIGTRGWTCGLL